MMTRDVCSVAPGATVAAIAGILVKHDISAEAVEPVQVCRFSRSGLRRLLDDFPWLKQRLLHVACDELVTARDQMLLGCKTARERVANLRVAQAYDAVSCPNPVDRIALPMSRADIADYPGLTIETVSRMPGQFRSGPRIATPSISTVIILNGVWLEALAAGHGQAQVTRPPALGQDSWDERALVPGDVRQRFHLALQRGAGSGERHRAAA